MILRPFQSLPSAAWPIWWRERQSISRRAVTNVIIPALTAAALLVISLKIGSLDSMRLLLCAAIFGTVWSLLQLSPATGVTALIGFLAILGGLRRWLIPVMGWPAEDPLLLIGPLIAFLFFANLVTTRHLRVNTRLSQLAIWLTGIMALEVINPAQGGLAIGIAGALFYIVPLLWFFAGRILGVEAVLNRLYQATIVVAIIGALYGLYQTFFGFLPSEREWLKLSGSSFQALNVGDTVRAISFFTSPAEYDWIMCFAIILLWAANLRGNRMAIFPIPLLFIGVFLESGRGPLVFTLATMTALWAVQGNSVRAWLPRAALALVLATGGLVWSMQQLQHAQTSASTQALVQHQTAGILNPGDQKSSTAGIHSAMMFGGVISGFTHPAGLGLGATTIAAAKLGGDGGSTEVDISNMFESLGFVGGLLYLAVVGVSIAASLWNWHRRRSLASLSIVGILLLGIGQWLNGGQYSTALLIWFSIGALDRMTSETAAAAPVPSRIGQDAPAAQLVSA